MFFDISSTKLNIFGIFVNEKLFDNRIVVIYIYNSVENVVLFWYCN